jgi:hypothetical protein
MVGIVQLGIFLAAMIALVVCGCIATRAPKKTPKTGPVKPGRISISVSSHPRP